MTRPSPEELLAETARLAYHLHWPLDTILDLEHPDRRRFLADVDRLARPARRGGGLTHVGRPASRADIRTSSSGDSRAPLRPRGSGSP